MKKFNNDFTSSDALSSFFKKNKQLEKGLDKINVREIWMKQFGKSIANYTTQIELQNTTLYVTLNSAALCNELNLGKSKIITALNQELSKELIKDIKFKIS